jgi:hypothetical protein
MAKQHVILSYDRRSVGDLTEFVDRVRAAGLQAEHVSRRGYVTGTVDDRDRPALARLSGVIAVETDQPVSVPPIGAPAV